jgi:glycosyltransferase involved in cell wall biosynthesis
MDTAKVVVDPRVSVIVPAYNAANCLERSLNSALAQTFTDLEVVVVDDASKDATTKWHAALHYVIRTSKCCATRTTTAYPRVVIAR